MRGSILVVGALSLVIALGPTLASPLPAVEAPAVWLTAYAEDFSHGAGAEWSTNSTGMAGDRAFLGEFGNSQAHLLLPVDPLPPGVAPGAACVSNAACSQMLLLPGRVNVTFKLFVLRSWDGNSAEVVGGQSIGPDKWTFQESNDAGTTSFTTTFCNTMRGGQSYPGVFPASNPCGYRASERNTLPGFTYACGLCPRNYLNNSVYNMSFLFEHPGGKLNLTFGASGLQSIADESWGIANMTVEICPAPAGYCERL